MNNRMMIAAMAMQGMLANSSSDIFEPAEYASDAVRYADALIAALAESEAERPQFAAGEYDEVGNWREYVGTGGEWAVLKVSARNMAYVDDAFIWRKTPQGHAFWEAIAKGNASALTITRAQRFAGRVLEAMEASDE